VIHEENIVVPAPRDRSRPALRGPPSPLPQTHGRSAGHRLSCCPPRLFDPTAFGKLNRKRNGAWGQNVRLSTHQDRPDVGGVGVERENSVHKIETQGEGTSTSSHKWETYRRRRFGRFSRRRATSILRSVRKERATQKIGQSAIGPPGWLEKGPSASLLVRHVSQRIRSSLAPSIQTLLKPTVCLPLMRRCTRLQKKLHSFGIV